MTSFSSLSRNVSGKYSSSMKASHIWRASVSCHCCCDSVEALSVDVAVVVVGVVIAEVAEDIDEEWERCVDEEAVAFAARAA